jgi:hypothetical protein
MVHTRSRPRTNGELAYQGTRVPWYHACDVPNGTSYRTSMVIRRPTRLRPYVRTSVRTYVVHVYLPQWYMCTHHHGMAYPWYSSTYVRTTMVRRTMVSTSSATPVLEYLARYVLEYRGVAYRGYTARAYHGSTYVRTQCTKWYYTNIVYHWYAIPLLWYIHIHVLYTSSVCPFWYGP